MMQEKSFALLGGVIAVTLTDALAEIAEKDERIAELDAELLRRDCDTCSHKAAFPLALERIAELEAGQHHEFCDSRDWAISKPCNCYLHYKKDNDRLTAEVGRLKAAGVPMFMVILDEKRFAAYPRRIQAEIYATGFSKTPEIVEGMFIATDAQKECGRQMLYPFSTTALNAPEGKLSI